MDLLSFLVEVNIEVKKTEKWRKKTEKTNAFFDDRSNGVEILLLACFQQRRCSCFDEKKSEKIVGILSCNQWNIWSLEMKPLKLDFRDEKKCVVSLILVKKVSLI
jgi:hypothetical protein